MIRFISVLLFIFFMNCAPVFETYLHPGETIKSTDVKIIRIDTCKTLANEKILHIYYVETKK